MDMDSGNNKKVRVLCLVVCAMVCFIISAICFYVRSVPVSQGAIQPSASPSSLEIGVSHSSGYYTDAIELELYAPLGYDILYTVTLNTNRWASDGRVCATGEAYYYTGGKDPDISSLDNAEHSSYDVSLFDSAEGRLLTYKYSMPLELYNTSAIVPLPVTVKAVLYRDGDICSEIFTYTYIFSENSDIFRSLVVMITTDDENLYDYERGIFVSGKTYNDALAAGTVIDPWTPRNFNQRGIEWERIANVTFYDPDGTLLLSQDAGIRVAGGTSRNAGTKSLKLIARSDYGDSLFRYPFFDDLTDNVGNPITSFKKLVLRNSENDIKTTMVRDELLHNLGGDVGVDYQAGRPVIVFLNGKYYAYMTLHESLDSDYVENHYGISDEKLSMVVIKSNQFQFRYRTEAGTEEMLDYYMSDMNYLINTDWSSRPISEIDEVIDCDNFTSYMAYQIFICNEDWPHNNVLAWKYFGTPNSSVTGTDGKWRFILKDLDFGLMYPDRNTFASTVQDRMFNDEPCLGTVLGSCLKNADFRKMFLDKCRNVASVLNSEYLTAAIDEAIAAREFDMRMHCLYNGTTVASWKERLAEWYDFAQRRHAYFLNFVGAA